MEQSRVVKELEVMIKIVVTEEDIDDIMAGALEGGINYWCNSAKVVGNYLGEYGSEQIARGGKLILHDFEEKKDHTLDLEKFLKGVELYCKKPTACNILEQIDGKLVLDCCNADALVCDAIIQYALFGDVIYG